MEKNINDELTKITREIDDTKRAKLKVVEQLDNFELIFRENANVFDELNCIWREGEMKKLIIDIESDIKKNQTQLLNELSSQEDELNRKKFNLENEYDNLCWEKEERGGNNYSL